MTIMDRIIARRRPNPPTEGTARRRTLDPEPPPPPAHQLQHDPCYCCAQCEALTFIITGHKAGLFTGAQLDGAVAAHSCTRSPIGSTP